MNLTDKAYNQVSLIHKPVIAYLFTCLLFYALTHLSVYIYTIYLKD